MTDNLWEISLGYSWGGTCFLFLTQVQLIYKLYALQVYKMMINKSVRNRPLIPLRPVVCPVFKLSLMARLRTRCLRWWPRDMCLLHPFISPITVNPTPGILWVAWRKTCFRGMPTNQGDNQRRAGRSSPYKSSPVSLASLQFLIHIIILIFILWF